MTIEDRIRSGLADAAVGVAPARRMGLEHVKRKGRRRRTRRRVSSGVVALAVVVVASTAVLRAVQTEEIYLADGEHIITTDPLIIQGAPAPVPNFDLSEFGDEEFYKPITDLDRLVAAVNQRAAVNQGGMVIRVTAIGTLDSGEVVAVFYYEDHALNGQPTQTRCVGIDVGGYCAGSLITNLVGRPGGLVSVEKDAMPSYAFGDGLGDLVWDAPPGTSVVLLTIEGVPRWQRPIGGVAAFRTEIRQGDHFQVAAYGSTGELIREWRLFASSSG